MREIVCNPFKINMALDTYQIWKAYCLCIEESKLKRLGKYLCDLLQLQSNISTNFTIPS